MPFGFGQVAFGRCQFGQVSSDIEPRFLKSLPVDEGVGISVLFVAMKTSIYGFSSRVQEVRVEVSEDGGDFRDAYVNGSFIPPYDGPDSYVDFHQADPQVAMVKVEKDEPWDENIIVQVRVTAIDEFGQEVTKVAPVKWE